MKVGDRCQVTIPVDIRERHGFTPAVEVEIVEEHGRVILRKKRTKACPLSRFVGVLGGDATTDDVIEELRGR